MYTSTLIEDAVDDFNSYIDNSRLLETLMQVSVKVPGCWCPSPKDIFMGLLI